jgi:hypothetical protein
LPNLTHLTLNGQGLDHALIAMLVNLKKLKALQVLATNDGYWRPDTQPAASGIDDHAIAALTKLEQLEMLVLPGTRITDQGLAELAKLSKLYQLALTGAPQITGHGFDGFANHQALAELRLSHCAGLDTAGVQAIARLPSLSHLTIVREPATSKWSADDTLASLQALATNRTLTRLELGGWLTAASQPGRALQALAKAPGLEWLSLADSPQLTIADLHALAGAKKLSVLDLSGTAGNGPGLIPVDSMDTLFERLPKLETIVTH